MLFSGCFNADHVVSNVPCAGPARKNPNLPIHLKSPIPSSVYVKAAVPNLKITQKFPEKRDSRTTFSGTTGNGLKCGPAG
jgi:hypothetical protein